MATILVPCRFCRQTHSVRKHGSGCAGYSRFRCLEYRKSFQLEYAYELREDNPENLQQLIRLLGQQYDNETGLYYTGTVTTTRYRDGISPRIRSG